MAGRVPIAIALAMTHWAAASPAADRLAACQPGDEWVTAHVMYECEFDEALGKGHSKPVACTTGESGAGEMVAAGATWSDAVYKYECEADGPDTLQWTVVACYTPAGVYLSVGDLTYEDAGYYDCRLVDAANGSSSVQRVWTEDAQCYYDGVTRDIGSWWRDGDSVFKCVLGAGANPVAEVHGYGCYLKSGHWLNSWQTGDGYLCACWNEPICSPEEDPTRCTDAPGGASHKVGELFVVDGVEYKCELMRGTSKREGHAVPLNCVVKTADGGQGKVVVGQAAKIDGRWLHCAAAMHDNKKTFDVVPLPDDMTQCDGGAELEAQWVGDNVHWHCCLSDGKAALVGLQCVTDEYTAVARHRLKFYDAEAFICSPSGEHGLAFEKLSDEEFALLKGRDNEAIKRVHAVDGRGVKWMGEDGVPIMCDDGYELADDECTDINECERGAHDCAEGVERCANDDGGYRCLCVQGYARRIDEQPTYCIALSELIPGVDKYCTHC